MTTGNDFNARIIEEFRANAGKLSGMFEGVPILILHSTGAKTGAAREHPIVYQQVGDAYAVFASYAGGPKNPAWYHNLVANPDATIELGAETLDVRARVTAGEERERIWSTQKERSPQFAEYEAKTDREIPVILLEPR